MSDVIRRPQRKLTAAEYDVVRGVKSLNFHRMLHLGLVDPVPNPSPMSEDEGAWVREHVWTKYLHHIDDGYAFGFWRWAMCERGTCWNCLNGRCEWCMHRQKGGPDVCNNAETVFSHGGRRAATLILRPGGEPCMWWCRCPCAKGDADSADTPTAVTPPGCSAPAPVSREDRHRGQDRLPGF